MWDVKGLSNCSARRNRAGFEPQAFRSKAHVSLHKTFSKSACIQDPQQARLTCSHGPGGLLALIVSAITLASFQSDSRYAITAWHYKTAHQNQQFDYKQRLLLLMHKHV